MKPLISAPLSVFCVWTAIASTECEFWVSPDGRDPKCTEASPGSFEQGVEAVCRAMGGTCADFEGGAALVLKDLAGP